jgi:hypothetical protein
MVLRNSRRHAARHFVHLSCTILLGFIGAASSGSFPSTGDHLPTGFLRAGDPAQHQPDLVADTASGLPLRDALLQAAAGAGIDRAKSPVGCDSDGHLWTPRCLIAVRGRHCSGDRDALSIAPPGNISLLGSRGAAIDCPVVLGAPPESASGPAAPGAHAVAGSLRCISLAPPVPPFARLLPKPTPMRPRRRAPRPLLADRCACLRADKRPAPPPRLHGR